MSLNLIPGRRSRKHSPDTIIRNLRQDIATLMNRQAAADDFFAILWNDVITTNAALEQTESKRQEAEEATAQMRKDRDEWMAEALALRARFGPQIAAEINANRVDVPPMARIGVDQDTTSIDVTALWDAAEAGLLPGCGPGRLTA